MVFIVGNSDHHVQIIAEIEKYCEKYDANKCCVYLHDVRTHNCLRKGLRLTPKAYIKRILDVFPERQLQDRSIDDVPWRISDSLVEKQIYGPRLLEAMGVKNFIVNSEAAKQLLLTELISPRSVETLPFPVFDATFPVTSDRGARFLEWQQGRGPLTIGCFGYPGTDKGTELVIEAVAALIKEGLPLKLLIVGYNSQLYINRMGLAKTPWITIRQPETQEAFEAEIPKCDIAIQLRVRNFGESSAVLPTLLRHGVPTISNNSGSFADFNKAVIFIDPVSADSIKGEIRNLKQNGLPKLEIENYVARNTISEYRKRFIDVLKSD